MKVKKAVIPAAGLETRFLPAKCAIKVYIPAYVSEIRKSLL